MTLAVGNANYIHVYYVLCFVQIGQDLKLKFLNSTVKACVPCAFCNVFVFSSFLTMFFLARLVAVASLNRKLVAKENTATHFGERISTEMDSYLLNNCHLQIKNTDTK